MIITCGSCGTKYSVADVALQPNGRRVRCNNCGSSWHQPPPSPPLAPAAPPPRADSAAMAEPPPPLPPRP
ncbi:MAG: zinc-ribbon domain-containing protein, partial [Rhodospirillaceae bacterium]|nr:zinc-ribbon domain-containing protein [Rhodospirillaceae bacterium]